MPLTIVFNNNYPQMYYTIVPGEKILKGTITKEKDMTISAGYRKKEDNMKVFKAIADFLKEYGEQFPNHMYAGK